MKKIVYIGFACLLFGACQKEPSASPPAEPEDLLAVPPGFPTPLFPADNELTAARFALGKRLFYDVAMSRDSTVSCASCHAPSHAFSDSVALSPGAGGLPGRRNAPTLANVAYQPYFTREGGVPTLEMQVLVPIQEHNEFDFNILPIAERLKKDTSYVRMSREAYGRDPDFYIITRSLACFERTLISGRSRFDAFYNQGDAGALTDAERRGMDLFFSERTSCTGCHRGFNFSNYAFENNGLYLKYADPGRFRLTADSADVARFKVPTLRNTGVTAPFMHDGSLPTLAAVVEHYNSGGKQHPHKNPLVRPLGLTAQEKEDLVAFLESLTDEKFITDPKFRE
ncbi:MAG TPA: cytochrome c peroxidase [Saprospiraceae bacterium]|nr:cytochrome c peroxidase [Saprospiraceae bacterium]HND89552.1 cytochrome c peroxidase [Saprospiraceae bacterium]HNG89895.1 cytochrome c peroxidase [Saprospiraceae bacterium]